MAATETRLLLLGAVSIFEPVNGYQLRRELMSWHVDEWAHIQPGSIYSGLSTLARQGHLTQHQLQDRNRSVAVYEMTDSGREEFSRLLSTAIETVDLLSPLAFHTALTLLPLVGRAQALGHLHRRLANLRQAGQEGDARIAGMQEPAPGEQSPPHIHAIADYWSRLGETERRWLTGFVEQVEAGELVFAGEQQTWSPPEDDPGWQMAADRQRYRELLGR